MVKRFLSTGNQDGFSEAKKTQAFLFEELLSFFSSYSGRAISLGPTAGAVRLAVINETI